MGYCPNEIFIDDANNIIITDINHGPVLVFNHKNMLFKKIGSFHESREVTMGYKCGYLLIADYKRGTYLLWKVDNLVHF